jgi:hypothetical protein
MKPLSAMSEDHRGLPNYQEVVSLNPDTLRPVQPERDLIGSRG